MKGYIEVIRKSNFVVFIAFAAAVLLYLSITIPMESPKNIEYKYDGIKYQAGNLQSSEPIRIEINGKYVKKVFSAYVDFEGTIKVGEEVFNGPIRFNKYKMGPLGEGYYGMIFIKGIFEKLTIEIHEPDANGVYSWSGMDGWLISAPCTNRAEAVAVSNELIGKLYKPLIIK